MYLVGGPERLVAGGERLLTSAEVLHEILHRYTALSRRDAIGPTLQLMLGIVDEVLPVEVADVLRAAEIAQHPEGFSARDAEHIAVMERHDITSILGFDGDFDKWPGLERIHQLG